MNLPNKLTILRIIIGSFSSFFERNVMQYDFEGKPVGFVGSVAFHYREVLEEAVSDMHLMMGKIVQSPMEGLIEFYRDELSE